MARKTYVDGGKKAIVYNNDCEPVRVYVDGELQSDISYTEQSVAGEKSVTYESEYKKNLLSLEIEGKTEQNSVPTLYNPADIVNTSNIVLKSRGANLLDMKDENITVSNLIYKQLETDFCVESNTTYTLAFDYEFVGTPVIANSAYKLCVAGYIKEGNATTRMDGKYFPNYEKSRFVYTFTTNASVEKSNNLFFRIPEADSEFTCELKISNIMLVKGNYNDLPYEPYILPQAIAIPITLCGIDGYNDSLTFDWKNKTIKKKKKVLYTKVSDLITDNATIMPSESGGITYYAVAINDIPQWIGSIDGGSSASAYFCTHCLNYHNLQMEQGELICELSNGYDNNQNTSLWFYYIEQSTVEDFKTWADENNLMVAYILKYDSEENVSAELMSLTEHTKNQTNIIEIISDLSPTNFKVTYAKWGGDVNA